jgi:hypothetical protein
MLRIFPDRQHLVNVPLSATGIFANGILLGYLGFKIDIEIIRLLQDPRRSGDRALQVLPVFLVNPEFV